MKPLILTRPWAAEPCDPIEVEAWERPSVLIPGMARRVRVLGSDQDLPSLGMIVHQGLEYSRFELIGPSMKSAGKELLELEFGDRRDCLRVGLTGGLHVNPEVDDGILGAGGRVLALLRRHVELLGEPLQEQDRLFDGCAAMDLSKFLLQWRLSVEGEDPRLALIVRIADRIGALANDLCTNPRRILRRDRCQVRVAQARQIDQAGIRWLVRQPGQTIAERAGPRQRILAVVREQSLDTFENRVLRDFLERALIECRLWLNDNDGFRERPRYKLVRQFGQDMKRHSRLGPIAGVVRAETVTQPNYVLQHDPRYSRVWPWYQKLRQRKHEEDNLWRWNQRTFAEAVRLGLAWALETLQEELRLPAGAGWSRQILIRAEQRHGALIDPRSRLAGWILRDDRDFLTASLLMPDDLSLTLSDPALGSRLRALAPDAVICAHSPFKAFRMRRAILVWARLRFGGHQLSSVELGEIAERLGSASGATSLTALLVEPAEKGSEVGIVERFSMPSSSGNRLEIAHAMVPLRLDRSGESFADLLRGVLVERGAR